MLLASVDWRHYMFMIPLGILSIFLILVILVQRGRGGGLTGALGGMGGQSAFGTKAGDLFTRITIVVAILWGLAAMATIRFVGSQSMTGGLSDVKSGTTTTDEKGKTEKTKGEDKKAPASTSKSGGIGSSKSPAETKPTETKPAETKPAGETPKKTEEPAK